MIMIDLNKTHWNILINSDTATIGLTRLGQAAAWLLGSTDN